MKTVLIFIFLACLIAALPVMAAEAGASSGNIRFYELRTYHVAPGKMEALHQRFRKHTMRLFQKHGMTQLGYWVAVDKDNKPENKLIFLLGYASREARESSWKAFMADPEWQSAYKESEAQGPLVAKAESLYLLPTEYTPVPKASLADKQRIFELRTYVTPDGKLQPLHNRFKNHTINLFSKHGMTNLGYFVPADKDKGADNTLVYILAHESREAARKSFDTFRTDPEWVRAKTESEKEGPLTVKDGVKSQFMIPADYSPSK